MAELKTQANERSVSAFLNSIENENKRNDCFALLEMMQQITGEPPQMWGDGIVGFGRYGYTYASGRSGEWFKVGFAPRKKNISIYIMSYLDKYESILARLGKYSTGKACLYINSLTDIDENVLLELIQQ